MTGSPVPLLDADVAHTQVLALLHAACFADGGVTGGVTDAWDAKAIAALLASPGASAMIAGPIQAPSGFLLLRVAADEAEIIAIGVTPERRRTGVGARLLAGAVARAATAGARRLLLEVADDNGAAQALYRSAGFRPVGLRRNYYQGRSGGGDAAILARDLAEPE